MISLIAEYQYIKESCFIDGYQCHHESCLKFFEVLLHLQSGMARLYLGCYRGYAGACLIDFQDILILRVYKVSSIIQYVILKNNLQFSRIHITMSSQKRIIFQQAGVYILNSRKQSCKLQNVFWVSVYLRIHSEWPTRMNFIEKETPPAHHNIYTI